MREWPCHWCNTICPDYLTLKKHQTIPWCPVLRRLKRNDRFRPWNPGQRPESEGQAR